MELESLSPVSLNTYFRTLRSLFNLARKKYNKLSLGMVKIAHYPFAEYKIPEAPGSRMELTEKQISGRVITLEIKYKDILEADSF